MVEKTNDETYQNIDRPYDSFLERTLESSGSGNALPSTDTTTATTDPAANPNGPTETQPVKNDGALGDVWITNFIRSQNWQPKSVGFFIDGQTGKAEFTNVYISGEIIALSGLIGGFTIGATDLSVTDGLNTTIFSSGSIAFAAGPTGFPTVTITQAGVLTATGAVITGTLTATTGTIGGWTISATTLTSTGVILDAGNQRIQVGSSAPILIDGINKKIESDNYVSGPFGSGFHLDSNLLEVGNIAARGLLRSSVFQKDVISVVGGNVVILDGDVLGITMTVLDSATLTIKGDTTFVNGDILRMKDTTHDEWFQITSIASAPTYVVTRDMAGVYASNNNPAWPAGTAVVNYRQSGAGGVYMTASDTNAPYLSIFDHTGSPWSTVNTRLRIGNLNGYLGYSSDLYGIAIGESTKYLKYDPTNGLRIKGDHAELDVGATGFIKGGQSSYNTGIGFWMGFDAGGGGSYKFSLGNPSGDHLYWDGSNLTLSGSASLVGTLPWSSITNDGHKPADDATVGADWGVNLTNIPTTLGTPSGAGLYLSPTNLGYYNGSVWKTYMDNVGNFYLGGSSGKLQWDAGTNTLSIVGAISSSTLNIPDSVTANSFHVDINGNVWWGATVIGGATAKVLNSGAATFTNVTITGGSMLGTSIASIPNDSSTDISLLSYTHDLVFSIDNTVPATTVNWLGGTITMSNGRTFTISSGTTGVMAAKNYIYLDTTAATVLSKSTTVSTAMGANKILIAVAQNGSGQATYQVYGGLGGLKVGSAGINIANNNWTYTGAFSPSSSTVVAWASGTLKTSDGTSYSITGSNTGTMAATTYIYFDLGTSSTVFQSTTTAATAIGDGKILIAFAKNNTNEAIYQVFGGSGGNNIDGSNIVTSSITSNELGAGSVTSVKGNIALRGWTQTATFSVSSATKVAWTGGTFTSSDGTSYTIASGDTGTMSNKTYIYLDATIPTPAYAFTSIATTAIGDGKVLIAIAQNDTNEATFMLLNNNSYNIDASNIVAGSLTANEIAANTITGSKIAATTITAANIAANTITSGQIAASTITAGNIVAGTITGTQIAASTITSGLISVSQLSAISADLGAITAGSVTINGGIASISSGGDAVFKSIKVGGSSRQYTLSNDGLFSYGDGADGTATCDGSTAVTGMSRSGSIYTMTRDVYFTILTINDGVTVKKNGYRLFVNDTLNLNGILDRNGNDGGTGGVGMFVNSGIASGGGGGAALSTGYLTGSLSGGSGANANPGAAGNGGSVQNSLGFDGNSGGGGGAGGTEGNETSGGSGGTATPSNVRLTVGVQLAWLLDVSSSGSTVKYTSSAAAGGGGTGDWAGPTFSASSTTGGGGGGGASAGAMMAVYAKNIIIGLNGRIRANGGVGGNGGAGSSHLSNGVYPGLRGSGGGGGGGGGNGGTIILAFNSIKFGNDPINVMTNIATYVTVNPGNGGVGGVGGFGTLSSGGSGINGSNGTAGRIYTFQLSL